MAAIDLICYELWYSGNVNQSAAPSQLSSELRSTDEGNVLDSEQPTPIRGAIPWVVGCVVAGIGVSWMTGG